MRWRGFLEVSIAALFFTGIGGAISHTGDHKPVRLDSGGSASPATTSSTSTPTPEPTTLLVAAPTTTAPQPTTTTTRPITPAAQLAKPGMYLVGLDGSARPAYDAATSQPSWSRDGKRLAFGRGSWGGGDTTLAIGDADGQSAQQFGDVSHNWYARWSPSGKWIGTRALAFSAPSQPGLDRVVVNTTSGAATILPGGDAAAGVWHPSDDRYLYTVGATSYIYDATSAKSTTVSFPSDGPLAWSPNGNQIASCSGGKVLIANIDGSAPRIVADIGGCKSLNDCAECGGAFEWTDGGILAHGAGGQMFVINATTGARKALGTTSTWASWSPTDHGLIALTQMENGAPTVVLMHADGSSPRTLARGPVGASIPYLAWAPAGDRLAVVVDPPPPT